jgi:hypothetical protein
MLLQVLVTFAVLFRVAAAVVFAATAEQIAEEAHIICSSAYILVQM